MSPRDDLGLFEPRRAETGPGLIVDSFAGGGGASLGLERALGRAVDIAINHDATALALHAVNHPETLHLSKNIWQVDPIEAVGTRPVDVAWFSPDCKHFSKAKGGRPVKRNIRDLAWVVVLWARRVRPKVILLENVEEFQTWGPVDADGRPCSERKGATFDAWVRELRRLGYRVEWRELTAWRYGAPTTRKRLFLVARCDGLPIVWPEPTHGDPSDPEDAARIAAGALKLWRTAAECIDWSIPTRSIFGRPKPLAENTMKRIARGVMRYVIEAERPFLIPVTHAGDARAWDAAEPLRTITTAQRGEAALVTPFLAGAGGPVYSGKPVRVDMPVGSLLTENHRALVAGSLAGLAHGDDGRTGGRAYDPEAPLRTIHAGGGNHALVAAFLAQHNTGVVGHEAREPVSTIVGRGTQQAIVGAHMLSLKGSDRRDRAADWPAAAVCAEGTHAALVASFLVKYYGQGGQLARADGPSPVITTVARLGLVTVTIDGEPYVMTDIGMRMLEPRELFRAQGFPDDYRIEASADGAPFTKTAQIKACGNSVCPPVAEALARANCGMYAAEVQA
jgi:DNA (cytosine-5)-methyltransferase 1